MHECEVLQLQRVLEGTRVDASVKWSYTSSSQFALAIADDGANCSCTALFGERFQHKWCRIHFIIAKALCDMKRMIKEIVLAQAAALHREHN